MPSTNKKITGDDDSDERALLQSDDEDGEGVVTSSLPVTKEGKEECSNQSHNESLSTPVNPADVEASSTVVPENEETKEEEEKASVSYFKLYRYSSKCEKLLVFVAMVLATITGIVPGLANFSFGQFTKSMVAYASDPNRKCPPDPSNETSPFMKEVQKFVIYQTSLGFLEFFCGYLFVSSLNYVAESQVYKIRKNYFRKLLQQDISWYDKNAKRDFSSRMVDDMLKIQNSLSEKIGMFVSSLMNCIFLTGLSFYLGWKLTLALMAFIPVLAIISGFDASVQSSMTTKEQDAYAEAGAIAEEVLTNVRTVHAFNGQDREIKRYDEKIQHARKVACKRHFLTGLGNGLIWAMSLTNFAYAFWYGSVLVITSRETGDGLYGPDNVLVILFAVMMAGFYFGSSSEYIEAIGSGTGSAASIFPILDRESEINSMSPYGSQPEGRPSGDIEFRDVQFSYPTRSKVQVLNKLCLRVKPGQTVALVGSSGCGKSTCVQLLQRFYDPCDGTILLDGTDIKNLNIKWLRSQLGVVGQEPVLFNMSIAENICFGLPRSVSKQEIEEVCKQAYAHNFIVQLPQGYDTRVGERGTSLSGGQKQRIAIARALIRNPAVLLLDEATSALDFQSEKIVQAALERASKGRSTLIIAHRLSTIKAADEIYVFDKGGVVEIGTHTDLMQRQGRYYQLVMNQEEKEVRDVEETSNSDTEDDNIEDPDIEEYLSSVPGTGRITSRTRLISQASMDEQVPVPVAEEEEEDVKKLSGSVSLRRLWKVNCHEWPLLLIVFMCSIIKGMQLPAYAYVFGDFIQSFTLQDDLEVLALGRYYCFIYLGIAAITGVCGFLQLSLVGYSGESFTYRVRKMVFKSVLDQDISFFDDNKNTVGKLTARLSTDATSIQGATGSRLSGVLQAFSIVIGAAAMSFYYLPNMAAITIVFVPLMIYFSFLEGRVMDSDNIVERDSIEASCNVAVEALNNIRTVASLCAEEEFIEKYELALEKAHKINNKRAHVRGFVYGVVQGGPMICYCMSLWYGGYLVEQSCVSIGNVFKVAEALIYCTSSGGAAIAYAPDYEKGKIAAARIFKLLDVRPTINRFATNIVLGSVKGQVNFDKVSFKYKNRPTVRVLKELSLEVGAGQTVAICGASGSGKSTCAGLIFRFYDPVSGTVKFDEFDLKKINLDFIRQQISLVSQEPILFDCSIRENIAYGDNTREVGMEEIIEAAKATNMHNFIVSQPSGYETRVGMLGSQMSGGQKQRIAIARAIIRQPKLLVLDEATSALDTESELAVQTALESAKSGRTSVTIAHRLSSIANSDKIFVMKNGRIEESGTHSELIHKNGGIYQTMWNSQSSSKTDTS